MRTGWPRHLSNFADFDNSVNNMLVETRASSRFKSDPKSSLENRVNFMAGERGTGVDGDDGCV
jgi:hypothetical protein